MQRLILDQYNLTLDYNNQCLLVRPKDKTFQSIPLRHIQQIICMHNVVLSSKLLGQLNRHHIDFIVLNQRYSENSVTLYGNQENQVERRCLQYSWQQSQQYRLPIAVQLCHHKLQQANRIIQKYDDHKTIEQTLKQSLERLEGWQGDENQLRGLEGSAQRQLFSFWRTQLPENLGFHKRQRRPPPDPVNGLLSLTYTLVYRQAIRQCMARALDSQLGFYHRPCFGRHSLACDIMETVRPSIEHWVVKLFVEKTFDLRHFNQVTKINQGCFLGKKGREIYYPLLSEQLPIWGRQLDAGARWISYLLDRGNTHRPLA
jgi:CRISPR-associated protein Cas1